MRLFEGPRDRCTIQPQTMFVRRKGWVTINFPTSWGGSNFFNKKYKGGAGRFYIHAHRDSFGAPPLLKNECSLNGVLTTVMLILLFAGASVVAITRLNKV